MKLLTYFTALLGTLLATVFLTPDALRWLPLGGTDAIEAPQLRASSDPVTPAQAGQVLLFLAISLTLAMLPITWTYKATQQQAGYRKTFVRALIILPVCATTIVLLIQDSLALAFGLAALVAAVRFRVALQDPIDGIYIFAAICAGLAVGIGYIGIAAVMAIVFCLANTILWQFDYGQNPLDDARAAKDRAKIERR